MRFGLQSINSHTCADPDDLIAVAQAAEAAGLDSLWTGEHLVLPSGSMARPDLPSTIPILDTITALTWVAAHTSTIRIGAVS